MKNLLFILLLCLIFSFGALAGGVDCNSTPTCAEMGYTKTLAECEGKQVLRCPLDITNDSAVFCN